MTTKPAQAKPSEQPKASPKSPAKTLQEESVAPPKQVENLAVTLRTDVGFEYHLNLPRPVVEGLIDPDTPDAFIEVPCPLTGMQRFLHTSYIKECDVLGL